MSEYLNLKGIKYSADKSVAASFAIGAGTKIQKFTPEMWGVPLDDALKAIDAWIQEKASYARQVKSLVGPILIVGQWVMFHIVLIRRPKTGLYQAIAEEGLVIKWLPDSPDLRLEKSKKKFLAGIEVREEHIPPTIKMPIDTTQETVYSCINNKKKGLDYCIYKVSKLFDDVQATPYHAVLASDITNKIDIATKQITRFYKSESKKYTVRSIYLEMTDLESNPHFAHMFGYSVDGGVAEIDWLPNYNGKYVLSTLTGFGRLRNVFEKEDPTIVEAYEDIRKASELLVALKFQRFIQRVSKQLNIENLSIYAAVHESDLVAKVY